MAVLMSHWIGVLIIVAIVASACQDDRDLTIINGCDQPIEFFGFAADGARELNEATLGDIIRLESGETQGGALYTDVENVEIYNRSLVLVLSFPTNGGNDLEIVIDSGCGSLRAGSG